MSHSSTSQSPGRRIRFNILTLDGGGVRGLSSLLILQQLLKMINEEIASDGPSLEPQDVFDLIAGTSTGGLIAIMLVKLHMSVEECISEYKALSQRIFGKQSRTGFISFGLKKPRYSGDVLRKCVQDLLRKKKLDIDHRMVSTASEDRLLCSVICREHSDGRFSNYRRNAVAICNYDCMEPSSIICDVCNAARATSAAPTYFDAVKIHDNRKRRDRFFADGAIGFNNPSFAVHDHYRVAQCIQGVLQAQNFHRVPWKTARGFQEGVQATQGVTYGGKLNYDSVRYVNLGTGTDIEIADAEPRSAVHARGPTIFKAGGQIFGALKNEALSSEQTAATMESIAITSHGDIKWLRFSADTGISSIEIDKYQQIQKMEMKTKEYLQTDKVKSSMRQVAKEIAEEYITKHPKATEEWQQSQSDVILTPEILRNAPSPEGNVLFDSSNASQVAVTLDSISVSTSVGIQATENVSGLEATAGLEVSYDCVLEQEENGKLGEGMEQTSSSQTAAVAA